MGPPLRRIQHRERLLGKSRRSCGTAPAEIYANPGPSGPAEIGTSHSDFARRKSLTYSQVRVPRDGGPGVSRHGEQSSPLRRPPAILWVLSHRWESTSPPGRRNPPRNQPRRSGETPLLKIKTKTAPGPTHWSEGGVIQNISTNPQARGWLLRYTSLIF